MPEHAQIEQTAAELTGLGSNRLDQKRKDQIKLNFISIDKVSATEQITRITDKTKTDYFRLYFMRLDQSQTGHTIKTATYQTCMDQTALELDQDRIEEQKDQI